MFGEQAVNATMVDLAPEPSDAYSHTGNSWNQSDIDSDYHRYDPRSFPKRDLREPEKNP